MQAVFTDARREIRGVDPQISAVKICIYLNFRKDGFQNGCIMSGLEARAPMRRSLASRSHASRSPLPVCTLLAYSNFSGALTKRLSTEILPVSRRSWACEML